MADKRMTLEDAVDEVKSGDTVLLGGGWGTRKPMALARALARSPVKDLTVTAWGGIESGILIGLNKVKKMKYGYVSLDVIPLEPNFRKAREGGTIEAFEICESMFNLGLFAGAQRLPFIPTRAGLGTDLLTYNKELKVIEDPYSGEKFVAMPALTADVAFIHVNLATADGTGVILGPERLFDRWMCMASKKAFMTCERIIPKEELHKYTLDQINILRFAVAGVIEAPFGAHPSACEPDYPLDYGHLAEYNDAVRRSPEFWKSYVDRYVNVSHQEYIKNVGGPEKIRSLA